MIPRILVPRDVRPPAETPEAPPRRLTTLLDDRMVLAANLPHITLDTRSSIPTHLPLGVLSARVVVPRDTPLTPLNYASVHPDYAPLTILDERVTVPAALPNVELKAKGLVSPNELPEVLESDVFTTGVVNLMVSQVERPLGTRDQLARVAFYGIAALNVMIFVFAAFVVLMPYRPPTQEQVDLANQLYMPLDVRGLTPAPATPPSRIPVDPKILRRVAPPSAVPIPAPTPAPAVHDTPVEPPPDLPVAPRPQIQAEDKAPDFLRQPSVVTPQPQPLQQPSKGLILPKFSSVGHDLEEATQQAAQGGGGSIQFDSRIRGGGGGGPGGGGGDIQGGAQIIGPTDGVNFDPYLQRVVASVKRNWEAIMPESVYLGDRGIVALQFCINHDGSVTPIQPRMVRSSTKEPLDRAASGSITASSPFEPLPSAFHEPCLELQFTFFYNLTPPAGQ